MYKIFKKISTQLGMRELKRKTIVAKIMVEKRDLAFLSLKDIA